MARVTLTIDMDNRAFAAIRRGVNGIIGGKVRDDGEVMKEKAIQLTRERLTNNRPAARRRNPNTLHYIDSFILDDDPEVDEDRVSIGLENFHPMARLIEHGNPAHNITVAPDRRSNPKAKLVFPVASTSSGGANYASTSGPFVFRRSVHWTPREENADGFHILEDARNETENEVGVIRVIVRPRVRV